MNESIISKINRNVSMQTDSLFMRVFENAMLIADKTDGSFDPTIAPVVNFWGFGFEEISNKKSYFCKHCNYKTSTAYILKRHEMTHTGTKPYSCRYCNKMFTPFEMWANL